MLGATAPEGFTGVSIARPGQCTVAIATTPDSLRAIFVDILTEVKLRYDKTSYKHILLDGRSYSLFCCAVFAVICTIEDRDS